MTFCNTRLYSVRKTDSNAHKKYRAAQGDRDGTGSRSALLTIRELSKLPLFGIQIRRAALHDPTHPVRDDAVAA